MLNLKNVWDICVYVCACVCARMHARPRDWPESTIEVYSKVIIKNKNTIKEVRKQHLSHMVFKPEFKNKSLDCKLYWTVYTDT